MSTRKKVREPPPPVRQGVVYARYAYPAQAASAGSRGPHFACAGFEEVTDGYRVARTGFPQYGLEFVASGRGLLSIGNGTYPLSAGMFFGYGPGVAHEIVATPGERMTKYFVDFSGRGAKRLMTELLPRWEPRRSDRPTEIRELMEVLLRQGMHDDGPTIVICTHLLLALIVHLHGGSRGSTDEASPGEELFRRAVDLVESDPLGFHTAATLAGTLGVTPEHLCRIFRGRGAESPYRLIVRARMRHAAALLREPGALVKSVAADVGFADPYHFSRVFKRVHGISPAGFAALQ